ncbi:MAG: succinylglutamate desuccinylase/aspartoacylase family protein [Bdellovibrio sp.]|nr:succinylglutamate desuccinylase/aspartoacylase family protein [Bdellovibrio sp.]
MFKILFVSCALLLCLAVPESHAIYTHEGYFIHDPQGLYLQEFRRNPDLVIDHRTSLGYELYGPEGLGEYLRQRQIPFSALEDIPGQYIKDAELADYPTSAQITQQLKEIVQANSSIMKLIGLGKSHEGKDLWIVKVSDNPAIDEKEPEFKFVANMHGNEIVGRELMVRLLQDLGKGYQQQDPFIRHLVNDTEIYIMPSMNPDGADKHQRGNSLYVDLNRNFPDFTTEDNTNTQVGRQPETQALMRLESEHFFALSANFHGGAVVFNYAWDTTPEQHPLDAFIQEMGLEYAGQVPEMRDSREFPRGITNGYAWYEVDGGMQDWSYYWHGDLQSTIELSDDKWPPYEQVDHYYQAHKTSLLNFIQRVHQGVGITFLQPTVKGEYSFQNLEDGKVIGPFPFDRGEFYKVLPDGKYRLNITTSGRAMEAIEVAINYQRFSKGTYLTVR